MNRTITLEPKDARGIVLRGALPADAPCLREWTNAQREFFFFNEEISEAMQTRWMSAYFERPDDFMFIVEREGRPVGCLGLRFEDGRGDIYNVILGDQSLRGEGVMSIALRVMLTFGRQVSEEIGLKVLKKNPAGHGKG